MRWRIALLTLIGLLAVFSVPAGAHDGDHEALHDLKVATARFHAITQAEKPDTSSDTSRRFCSTGPSPTPPPERWVSTGSTTT